MSIRIVTDSTCDLPPEIINQYGIRVVPLYINIGNTGLSRRGGAHAPGILPKLCQPIPAHPTTAAPSPDKYQTSTMSLANEGATEILSIHISIALSAVVDTARMAAGQTEIDSRDGFRLAPSQSGHGVSRRDGGEAGGPGSVDGRNHRRAKRSNQALARFRRARHAGISQAERANEWSRGRDGHTPAAQTDFDDVRRQARRRARPHDANAQRNVCSKCYSEAGALERVAIIHTNAPDRVAALRQQAAHWLPPGDILTMDITPVIGAHIGPGMVGFVVVSK